MEINVYNLILEVTRKCNMACEHCLRGEAENVNMSNKIIDRVLEEVVRTNHVSFTGGEPTLNMKAIEYLTKSVKEKSYPLDAFWMATNAKEYNANLVTTLLDLYDYCVEFSGEEDLCGLAVSQDMFHYDTDESALRKYKALRFYDSSKETDFNHTRILDEGYANENGIGNQMTREYHLNIEIYDDVISIDELYINAKGDVIAGCDYSYDTQDRIKLGNIMNEPLLKILKRANPSVFKDYERNLAIA